MGMVIALIFGGIIWVICKSFRSTVENVKYQHKTCPFCGSTSIFVTVGEDRDNPERVYSQYIRDFLLDIEAGFDLP